MKKFVTFGELMLRLSPQGTDVLFQKPSLEATFGGAEANVAVSLANYGEEAVFVTALPDNPIADAAVRELRGFGVDTQYIRRSGSRVGIYYAEKGACMRPSKVVYDRAHSSITEVKPGDFDWKAIFDGAAWFHTTGITPAVAEGTAEVTLEAMKAAHEMGVKVSCDLNYRKKLWKWGKSAQEVMSEITKYVDVLIANEEDCQKCLGIELDVDVTKGSTVERCVARGEGHGDLPERREARGQPPRERQRRHQQLVDSHGDEGRLLHEQEVRNPRHRRPHRRRRLLRLRPHLGGSTTSRRRRRRSSSRRRLRR